MKNATLSFLINLLLTFSCIFKIELIVNIIFSNYPKILFQRSNSKKCTSKIKEVYSNHFSQ